MRVLKIDTDLSVTELDLDEEDWKTDDITWDAVDLGDPDGHDIWVNDFGMFDEDGFCGIVAGKTVPLPAYVAGASGEETVAATIEVERLEALIG